MPEGMNKVQPVSNVTLWHDLIVSPRKFRFPEEHHCLKSSKFSGDGGINHNVFKKYIHNNIFNYFEYKRL